MKKYHVYLLATLIGLVGMQTAPPFIIFGAFWGAITGVMIALGYNAYKPNE